MTFYNLPALVWNVEFWLNGQKLSFLITSMMLSKQNDVKIPQKYVFLVFEKKS